MMDPCKILKIEGDELIDKLTDLPINVKHQIQENLPIDEAARMTVLSTSWRHVWPSIPNLVFSPQFCQTMLFDTLIEIITKILSQHDGAIKTFLLNISSIPHSQHYFIDQWMLLLSRNGLMDLTLKNMNNYPYILPSYMCSVELEYLNLSNCILRPPCRFRGFHKLKSLLLLEGALELDDVATSFLWMPNLVRLIVKSCIGLDHLKIYAPKLVVLFLTNISSKTLKLDDFIDCRELKIVTLAANKHQEDKVMNLTYLLDHWPEVIRLILDSYYLKSFASGIVAERLPTCLNNLRVLAPLCFDFDDEDQTLSLLRMLRSCPNLEDLIFRFASKKKGRMELVDVNHFEEPAYTTQGLRLNKLKKLEIDIFHGSRAELLFVRFIRASASSLLKTILMVDAENVDESQCLKITKDLMGFPRASPKLEIICEPSERGNKLLFYQNVLLTT